MLTAALTVLIVGIAALTGALLLRESTMTRRLLARSALPDAGTQARQWLRQLAHREAWIFYEGAAQDELTRWAPPEPQSVTRFEAVSGGALALERLSLELVTTAQTSWLGARYARQGLAGRLPGTIAMRAEPTRDQVTLTWRGHSLRLSWTQWLGFLGPDSPWTQALSQRPLPLLLRVSAEDVCLCWELTRSPHAQAAPAATPDAAPDDPADLDADAPVHGKADGPAPADDLIARLEAMRADSDALVQATMELRDEPLHEALIRWSVQTRHEQPTLKLMLLRELLRDEAWRDLTRDALRQALTRQASPEDVAMSLILFDEDLEQRELDDQGYERLLRYMHEHDALAPHVGRQPALFAPALRDVTRHPELLLAWLTEQELPLPHELTPPGLKLACQLLGPHPKRAIAVARHMDVFAPVLREPILWPALAAELLGQRLSQLQAPEQAALVHEIFGQEYIGKHGLRLRAMLDCADLAPAWLTLIEHYPHEALNTLDQSEMTLRDAIEALSALMKLAQLVAQEHAQDPVAIARLEAALLRLLKDVMANPALQQHSTLGPALRLLGAVGQAPAWAMLDALQRDRAVLADLRELAKQQAALIQRRMSALGAASAGGLSLAQLHDTSGALSPIAPLQGQLSMLQKDDPAAPEGQD